MGEIDPRAPQLHGGAVSLVALVSDAEREFWTGTAGPFQVIIGFLPHGLLLVRFRPDGGLVNAEARELSEEAELEQFHNPSWSSASPADARPISTQELRRWQAEIGFVEGPIHIAPFRLEPEYPVVLDVVGGWVREALADPGGFSAEEVAEATGLLRDWRPGDGFSFCWNEEHLMNADGTSNTS